MPSFDIVSELNMQEVENAINHAKKELTARYDLKGSKAEIQWDKKTLAVVGDDEYKLNAVKDILQSKLHKRGIDIRSIKFEDQEAIGGMMLRRKATLIQGIEKELAKTITKKIRDSKLKVQAQIQDESIRVTSKSRDELQECMTFLKSSDIEIPLQFNNFRD
ncbi:MAG: YajQ family cyclic di-GMP-binding protein [Bdellovibrionales bacterium]